MSLARAALVIAWLLSLIISFGVGHEVGQEEPCVTDHGPGTPVDWDCVNRGATG